MHGGKLQVLIRLLLIITTKADLTTVVGNVEYLFYHFGNKNGRLSYIDANTACLNIGGELALINDVRIQNAIQPHLIPDAGPPSWLMGYWIGGSCSDNCKIGQGGSVSNKVNWKWGDGSAMYDGYTNWYSNLEPNNPSNVAAYVYNFHSMPEYYNTFGTWGDDDVTSKKNYICQRDAECYPNPCMNGATCQLTPSGSYNCQCAPGFGGINCVTEYCVPSLCQNHGTCVGTDGGYECDCPVGVIGTSCEIDICAKNPCENGGTCIGIDGAYECSCLDGFNGPYCETELCRKDTCKNGGTCIQTSSEAKCECQSGYIGSRCEIDLCAFNPCQNGGTCIGTDGGHICSCPVGFKGANCETDACDAVLCQNGGTCQHAAVTGFKCECKKGYKGTTCQIVETVDNTWIPIVAGTLGGVALLVIIAVIVYCCLKQRYRNSDILHCCFKKKRMVPPNTHHSPNMQREVRESYSEDLPEILPSCNYSNPSFFEFVSNKDEESTT